MRTIRMLAIGLAGLVLPLSLTTGGLTPLAAAAVPTAAPLPASGAVAPAADVSYAGTLTLNPVANAKGGSITAKFTGSAKVKNRPVKLYQASTADGPWTRIGPSKGVKLSSSGTAVFKVTPDDKSFYQAVAGKYTYKVKKKKRTAVEARTAPTQLIQQWTFKADFSDEFAGDALNPYKWQPTAKGVNTAGNRWCSVPWDDTASIVGGKLKLSMRKAPEDVRIDISDKAKVLQRAAKKSAVGCPSGVYLNARVSNEHTDFRIKDGIVAAEITFPIYQGGHGGIWLRTANNAAGRFDEIDIIEAFGWKKGVQSVLHWGTVCKYSSDRDCETKEKAKWVAKKTVGKSSWWGKPHVFSAEFNRTQVIFRIDGVVTRIDKRTMPNAEYSLVMSMLSSDYELARLSKPAYGGKKGVKLPLSASVNWVRAWTPAATS